MRKRTTITQHIVDEIWRLKANGMSQRSIVNELEIGLSTVQRYLRNGWKKPFDKYQMSQKNEEGDGCSRYDFVGCGKTD